MVGMMLLALALTTDTPNLKPAISDLPKPALAADSDQKVRCRTEIITGTLVGRMRTCHTNAEWRKLDGDAQRDAQAAVDHGLVSCGKCNGGE